jgi:prephenate dehydrogenase
VALAAKARGIAGEVALWARRESAAEELRGSGAIDVASTDLAEVLAGANLVVLATPVGAVENLLVHAIPLLGDGVVVTDLCSVKGAVEEAVARAMNIVGARRVHFVGAHPMAGSERTGFANASPELFEGAACALTRGEYSTPESFRMTQSFWTALGCKTLELGATEHDEFVARISHMPHIAASALVNAALSESKAGKLAGPGFRDSTRIASGSPKMWTEIAAENRSAVISALEEYVGQLGEVLAKLRDMDNEGVCRFLADAQSRRATLFAPEGDEA